MKILMIYGTRPEFLKLIPVIKLMKGDNFFDLITVSTGQHKELMEDLYEQFNFLPDIEFNVMEKNQNPSDVIVSTQILLQKIADGNEFDYIMVQGDTATVFSGALTGFLNKIPVIHVEAGMRTFDLTQPFPEEGFRQMISMITRINYVPTELAAKRLIYHLGHNHYTEHDKEINKDVMRKPVIKIVGNTIIDTVHMVSNLIDNTNNQVFKQYAEKNKQLITVTLHRRENHEVIEDILKTIEHIAISNDDIKMVFPVHPNPNVKNKVHDILGNLSNVELIEPLKYFDMIHLLKETDILMTDSGGLQEEAATLNLPTIVLRETTERIEGIKNGNAIMGYTKSKYILEAMNRILNEEGLYNKMASSDNPYGDGQAAQRIINHLKGDEDIPSERKGE